MAINSHDTNQNQIFGLIWLGQKRRREENRGKKSKEEEEEEEEDEDIPFPAHPSLKSSL